MGYLLGRADAIRLPLPDRSVDLVVGSPPYVDARLYLEFGRDLGIARGMEEWIDWMLRVTTEALRVSRGAVVWVAAGVTRDRNYWPACEGLMYRWWQGGGHAYRPCYWRRNGIMGSGGDQWFRADVEYAMCFKRPGELPWSDNKAMGGPPKHAVGGSPTHRLPNGTRVGYPVQCGHANSRKTQIYQHPDICNPGNFLHTNAGYGHMGHNLAHENEAPYPAAVPEFFIRSLCPPGGLCLDPFSGSGTTCEAALKHGRRAVGLDLRDSQCRLARRRLERPHAPIPKDRRGDLPGQMSFLGSIEAD